MANCSLCGKKLGLLETITREFPGDMGGTCIKCHRMLMDKTIPQIQDVTDLEQFDDIKKKLLDVYSSLYGEEGALYLHKILSPLRDEIEQKIKQEHSKELALSEIMLTEKLEKQHMFTTGYNFEGYIIKEYKSVISGSTVLGTGFLSELFASTSDLLGEE